jgi:hypothetical protein
VYYMRQSVGVLFFTLIFAACLMAQTAEPQATMAAHPKQVKQGEEIDFTVTVSPKPNVAGQVSVIAAPDNGPGQVEGHNGIGPDGATAQMGANIPVGAKLGTWKVTHVMFRPAGAGEIELSVTGKLTFEVIERKAELPSSAIVEVK